MPTAGLSMCMQHNLFTLLLGVQIPQEQIVLQDLPLQERANTFDRLNGAACDAFFFQSSDEEPLKPVTAVAEKKSGWLRPRATEAVKLMTKPQPVMAWAISKQHTPSSTARRGGQQRTKPFSFNTLQDHFPRLLVAHRNPKVVA